jgi:hypothetical protein
LKVTSLQNLIPFDFSKSTGSQLKVTYLQNLLPSDFPKSIASQFEQKIMEWIEMKPVKLLYKASQDNFAASSFHQRCDNKESTLTIIKSNGYLFGGYTPNSWNSSDRWVNDSTNQSFIFTLTNPHSIPPTKYSLVAPENSIYYDPSLGPSFGYGCDICIWNHSNNNSCSSTKFPSSYSDSTGNGKVTFTGQYCFTVQEIEVFGFN